MTMLQVSDSKNEVIMLKEMYISHLQCIEYTWSPHYY